AGAIAVALADLEEPLDDRLGLPGHLDRRVFGNGHVAQRYALAARRSQLHVAEGDVIGVELARQHPVHALDAVALAAPKLESVRRLDAVRLAPGEQHQTRRLPRRGDIEIAVDGDGREARRVARVDDRARDGFYLNCGVERGVDLDVDLGAVGRRGLHVESVRPALDADVVLPGLPGRNLDLDAWFVEEQRPHRHRTDRVVDADLER